MTTSLESNFSAQNARGQITLQEIRQQLEVWPTTLARVAAFPSLRELRKRAAVICGAGSSAYAGAAVALNWANARAVPTTDLLVQSKQDLSRMVPDFAKAGLLVSLARSGESPESVEVVGRMKRLFPEAMHLAITCNEHGQLARMPGVDSIVLDPRTNDRSLVMTGSFSNLVLAGMAVERTEFLATQLPQIASKIRAALPQMESAAHQLAVRKPSRVMVLTPPGLTPLGQEACLKILEMTAGHVVAVPETYLGLRHGPMSYLRSDTLVLGLLSSDERRKLYEFDLIRELREKGLGHIVLMGSADLPSDLAHHVVPAVAVDLPDELRTPFEIVFAQLLGYSLGLGSGLDPDNPSPDGVITRVVRKFQLHDDSLKG